MKKNIFLFLNLLFFPLLQTKVALELLDFENVKDQKTGQETPTVYAGNTFRIKVTVKGAGDFGGLEVLGLENFKIQGTSQSQSSILENSKLTKKISFTYDVYADKEGTFTLGPARVRENGTLVNSEPEKITFNVSREPAGRVAKSESGKYELQGSDSSVYELFCRATVDKSKVVVGEPVVYTASIFARGNLSIAGIKPSDFSAFLSKEISQVVRREEVIDGKKYSVLDKKYLLLPTQPGDLQLLPIEVYFNIPLKRKKTSRGGFFGDDFFDVFGPRYETKRASSQEVLLKVDKLPPYSGKVDGVGAFTNFSTDVDKKDAIINEPILLGIEIEGRGNLDQIVAPKLNLPSFVTNYESKTDLQQDLSRDFVGGKKRFEFVIQVGRQGECEIPAQKFTYFDTISRTYKALSSNPILLNIKTPPEGQQQVTNISPNPLKTDDQKEKQAVKFKKDINFIEENFSQLLFKKEKSIPLWIFLILILAPAFFSTKFFSYLGFLKIRNWFKSKYVKRKSTSKFKSELEKIIKNGENLKIYQFFLKYFSYKFNVSISEVTEDWIAERLLDQSWQKDRIDDFLSYLNQCASLSFASRSQIEFDSKKLVEKSKYWFFLLESKSE